MEKIENRKWRKQRIENEKKNRKRRNKRIENEEPKESK